MGATINLTTGLNAMTDHGALAYKHNAAPLRESSAEGIVASISTAGTGPDFIGAGTPTVEVSAGAARKAGAVGITTAAEVTSAAVIMVGGGHHGGGPRRRWPRSRWPRRRTRWRRSRGRARTSLMSKIAPLEFSSPK